jgi:hypothetical protein
VGGALTKVYLTGDRGWASPDAARSITRIDRRLGRPADINEAGRSPEQADANHRAWLAYLAGGPKAPYALPASQSVHCQGDAADTDDWYDAAAAAVWYDHGWRQTARYPNNPKKDEPWHGEYFAHLDNHRHEVVELINDNGTWRIAPEKEWDEMATKEEIRAVVADEVKQVLTASRAISEKAVAQKSRVGAYKIVAVKRDIGGGKFVNDMYLTGPGGRVWIANKLDLYLLRRYVQATPHVADNPLKLDGPGVNGEEIFTQAQFDVIAGYLARLSSPAPTVLASAAKTAAVELASVIPLEE